MSILSLSYLLSYPLSYLYPINIENQTRLEENRTQQRKDTKDEGFLLLENLVAAIFSFFSFDGPCPFFPFLVLFRSFPTYVYPIIFQDYPIFSLSYLDLSIAKL